MKQNKTLAHDPTYEKACKQGERLGALAALRNSHLFKTMKGCYYSLYGSPSGLWQVLRRANPCQRTKLTVLNDLPGYSYTRVVVTGWPEKPVKLKGTK